MARSPLCRKPQCLSYYLSPKPDAAKSAFARKIFLLCYSVLLAACHSQSSKSQPSIELSKIPPAAQGGRERVDTIAGRVHGVLPGQQIVVYARSGPWWVQPWPDQPFIPIQSDSTWSTPTHLGYEYAVLLVNRDYHPPPTMDTAPTEGGSVVLVNIVKSVGSLPPLPTQPLHFSGYDWAIQTDDAVRGGVNNLYDADNVWTEPSGALHLRISKKAKGWTCAHLIMTRSLGYGTYRFVVRDTEHLEPAAVLSMHTFDQWGGEQHYREMDIEIGRWGDAASKNNAQYGLQPFYVPGNVVQFREPAGTLTHTLVWESGRASFQTVHGASPRNGEPVVYKHAFISGVPTPGREFLEFMFYIVPTDTHPMQKDAEVIIEKFEYLP
jgi:hypothetical protein